jgi:hypothetical protein
MARVVQALFPNGRLPAKFAFGAAVRAPHPAQSAQRRAASPVPSTRNLPAAGRPPHPATVVRSSAEPGMRAHPVKAWGSAQRAAAPVAGGVSQPVPKPPAAGTSAFQTPAGFLAGASAQSGQSLPMPVQKKMETFFGADFSEVRVHVGTEATSIGAIAFTLGSDLYFAPGYYEPHTPRGQELLGHELTHVVQQRDGRVANPFGDGVAVVQDPELEAEADRMGKAAAASAQARMAAPAVKTAQLRAGTYELVVGAYMHQGAQSSRLPEDLAGHSFVAIREPGGEAHAFGFSPADYGKYDPQKDLDRLKTGVEGVVHDDAGALHKPGVKTRSYRVTATEAQAALAKVEEYRAGKYPFSLERRQCSTFALDVLRAAKIGDLPGAPVRRPRELYRQLG